LKGVTVALGLGEGKGLDFCEDFITIRTSFRLHQPGTIPHELSVMQLITSAT
jgi:hypothetical protein